MQALDATIYFPKEKQVLYFQVSHSYFPDKYWGTGQCTKNKDGERYVFEQYYIAPHVKYKVAKNIFIGLLAEYQNVYHINYIRGGVFDRSSMFGKNSYDDFGVGVSFSYDTRNNAFWPSKGIFIQTQFTNYDTKFFSSYSFIKSVNEIRYFKKTIFNQIFAIQLYNYTTIGNTPLRSLAAFGGTNNLRGFYQGRYRDNSMYSIIGEYRIPIYNRFSVCTFAGLGDVYTKINEVNASSIKYSFGGGVRYSIVPKDKLNIRVDYGYSSHYNRGLYFTIGECF